ncbi:MAG: tripartite tricarboxylate transporter TctB family protein [Devosia sp.]|mgnify:CR=1 FL=1
MTINRALAEWLVAILFVAVVGLVFQQAATDMAAQGIASGGPYDNAAAYPKTIAIVLGILTFAQVVIQMIRSRVAPHDNGSSVPVRQLVRPAAMVVIFAVYLGCLDILGYHIATPIMLATLMGLCGIRKPLAIVLPAILVSLGFAYVFEAWLKIVLPGGFLHLNIAW